MGAFAWVTLATNDSYSLGALVLAHSLKQAGTAHQLAVLVTPGVTSAMREKLSSVFNVVQEVNILDSRDEANLRLLKRPELGITFTKLHCWRLTQYEKCVFLDADTLVLQNSDELFEREELSAAPDVGWPDCFNSGVFVYRPSLDTYEKLIQFALEKGSFDGGDQGLLNLYFSDWAHKDISKHLPFIYNMCSTACYSYLPAFKQFGANAKIIHFIGAQKPWLQYFNTETKKVQPSGDSSHLQEVLQRWWDIFCSLIHPHLSPAMQGQSQHGMNPSYSRPQSNPPTYPIASADDYENAWDPWDEYDQKVAQNARYTQTSIHNDQNQPIKSLNTNASRVADQPSILSQPQPHNYNTYSVQNNSYYQPPPPQVVYHDMPRAPTPPQIPRFEHYHQPPELHHHEPQHFYSEPQTHHSTEQFYHHEPQPRQEYHEQHHYQNYQQHQPPQEYHEQHYQEHQQQHQYHEYHQQHEHQHYSEPQFYQQEHVHYHNHQQHDNHESTYHSSEQLHQKNELVYIISHEPHTSHIPERPGSPARPVPLLPKECEATTTVSNDMSLSSTIEDSNKHENAGLAGAFSQLTLGIARTPEQDLLENILRKQAWEVGNIDYLGKDSFENIWSKITETLNSAPQQPQAAAPEPEPEVPSAPVESQSQTAPQEEAKPVQTSVLPLDISTDNITSIDAPKIDSPVETQVEKTPALAPTGPPQPDTSTQPAEIKDTVTEVETTKVITQAASVEGIVEPEVKPVTEPLVCPIVPKKEVTAEVKPREPESVPAQAPTETTSEPSSQVLESQPIVASESPQAPKEPAQAEQPQLQESAPSPQEPVAEPPSPLSPEQAISSPTSETSQSLTPASIASSAATSPSTIETPTTEPPKSTEPSIVDAPVVPTTPEVIKATPSATPATPPVVAAVPPVIADTPTSPPPVTPTAPSAASAVVAVPSDAPVTATAPSSVSASSSTDSATTPVVAATPPTAPITPPAEKPKQVLTAEASVPDTPPPSEGGSTPTPPPRKTDKPKKVAAKSKK